MSGPNRRITAAAPGNPAGVDKDPLMGHSHHWKIPAEGISPEAWAKICADAAVLFDKSPVTLVGDLERLWIAPRVNAREIAFNALEAPCEDFALHPLKVKPSPRYSDWDHVKTEHQPYDIVVLGMLAMAQTHASDLEINGDASTEDWEIATTWAAYALGRPIPVPTLARESA